jgi:ribosomal-protein-alanine N-acetyltransferase
MSDESNAAVADGVIPEPTERLRFRQFRQSDVAALGDVFRDPYARRFYEEMQVEGAATRFVERQLDRYREFGHGLWVLERRDDGAFVGDCGLTYQPTGKGDVLEIGYHVGVEHRRHGYATEAAGACREHAFRKLGAEFVASIVDPQNEASRTVAGRIHRGMRWIDRDGTQLCLYFTDRVIWNSEQSE